MKVLVIDDDLVIRDLLKMFLEPEGFEVFVADNGRKGVEIQRKTPCEILICDLIMPEQEGIETIVQFNDEFSSVGIIAISGGGKIGPDSYLEVAKQLGAWKAFIKPLDREAIVGAVKELSEIVSKNNKEA